MNLLKDLRDQLVKQKEAAHRRLRDSGYRDLDAHTEFLRLYSELREIPRTA